VVALRCYYQNVGGLTDQIELHFVEEVLPGYFWIFPLEDGHANVGIGMLHEAIKRRKVNLKAALQTVINSPRFRGRFAQAKALEEPVGWNLPVGSKHRKIYGNGFMLLGDAAGLIDPFTGEGIGNAMYSALFAVETAKEACEAGDFSQDFLARYDKRLWAEIGDELKVSTRLQQLGRSRFLLNLVIDKAARNKEVHDLIYGMLMNEIPKKKLTNPLFYLKLLFS
jgi:flavin-dependent dehydrogenase